MKFQRLVLLGIVILALITTFFYLYLGEEEVSADKIRELALIASEKRDYYKFDGALIIESGVMSARMEQKGTVDCVDKRILIEIEGEMKIMDKEVSMDGEEYLIGDTLYMKINFDGKEGKWYKMEFPSIGDAWSMNQGELFLEMLEDAEVFRLKDEVVKGEDCFVLRVKFSPESIDKMYKMYSNLMGMKMDIDIDKAELEGKYWISKESGLIVKAESTSRLYLKKGGIEIPIEVKGTYYFYDYGVPVRIQLPSEAENAIPTER